MTSIVNSSLDLLRRPKTKKQPSLHARWGDVQITVPTDGAWTQFNNPYKRESMKYGPGFVPGLDTITQIQDDECNDADYPPEYVETISPVDEPLETRCLSRASTNSTYSTSSSSVTQSPNLSTITGTFNPRRLTRILLPSNSNSPISADNTKKSAQEAKPSSQLSHEPPVPAFEYKPVRPDYAREVTRKVDQERAPRFRYVPATENFRREMEEIRPPRPPRSSSQTSPRRRSPEQIAEGHARSRSCDPLVYDPWDHSRRALQPIGVQEVARARERNSSMKVSRLPHFPSSQIPEVIQEEDPRSRGRHRMKDHTTSRRTPSLPTPKVEIVTKRSRSAIQPRRRMTTRMVSDYEDLW